MIYLEIGDGFRRRNEIMGEFDFLDKNGLSHKKPGDYFPVFYVGRGVIIFCIIYCNYREITCDLMR